MEQGVGGGGSGQASSMFACGVVCLAGAMFDVSYCA